MLLFHVGKEHSNLRLPQEIDTSGLDVRQRSTQEPWVGKGLWKPLNCSLSETMPARRPGAKVAIWQPKTRQAAGYYRGSQQCAWGRISGARSSSPVSYQTLEVLKLCSLPTCCWVLCPGKGGLAGYPACSFTKASGYWWMLLGPLKAEEIFGNHDWLCRGAGQGRLSPESD